MTIDQPPLEPGRNELQQTANPELPTINAPIETELSANNAEGERVWVHIWEMGMDALSKVVKMGRVQTSRDFIFILNAIRQALHR